jgi:N-acetyl-gamma-glutamyl-phosphate reductase
VAQAGFMAQLMTHTLFIDGAVGTTGLEIADRLAGRAEFSQIILPEDKRKDAAARREALNDADFVILCLPDEAAKEAVAMIANDRTRVIDASTAHRVDGAWVYGFPEFKKLQHERIAKARHVSNPGCYPTGFLALVAPLVMAGLIPDDWPYTVNAVSGYSRRVRTSAFAPMAWISATSMCRRCSVMQDWRLPPSFHPRW